MPHVTNDAAHISPPRSGKVQQVAATTTVATTALDTDFLGKWVSVYVIDGTVKVLFGTSAVTVDATATSGTTLGKHMTAGEERHYKLAAEDTHIACDCASGTATVEITLAGK
jgi:hypothetical protein